MILLNNILEEKVYSSSPFNGFNKRRIKIKKNYITSVKIDRNNISLLPFNTQYWENLPTDKNQLMLDMARGQYLTITSKGLNIGVVGIFLNKERHQDSFFQIYIDPDYRGLGLGRPVAYIVAKRFNINKLVSIVDTTKNKRGDD